MQNGRFDRVGAGDRENDKLLPTSTPTRALSVRSLFVFPVTFRVNSPQLNHANEANIVNKDFPIKNGLTGTDFPRVTDLALIAINFWLQLLTVILFPTGIGRVRSSELSFSKLYWKKQQEHVCLSSLLS